MNDMERRKFEDSFQEAFQHAEVNPSENVWTNIELDLEKAEGDKMKRRLIFFKMLAAASVIFAMTVAGIGYYLYTDPHTNDVARGTNSNVSPKQNAEDKASNTSEDKLSQSTNEAAEGAPKNSSATPNTESNESTSAASPSPGSGQLALAEAEKSSKSNSDNVAKVDRADATISDQSEKNSLKIQNEPAISLSTNQGTASILEQNSTSSELLSNNNNGKAINEVKKNNDGSTLIEKDSRLVRSSEEKIESQERKLPAFYEPKQPELQLPQSTADPGMLLLARLDAEEKKYAREEKDQKKNNTEKLWTSVGFAAGAFDSNNPSVSPVYSNSAYSLNATNTAAKQSQASGIAYSVGVSVGTRISKRWVVQGGFSYLTQSSDYTANGVVVGSNFEAPKAESLNAFNSQLADVTAETRVAQTYPYNVNNSVRFVSVPVQAGYLVINKKFGLQVNAGVATDLFLQNTITPDGGGLSKTTQSRGSDSPYRSLNFSGLMGTELSYKLGYRYRVSLNPGLRYPFSSVYKSNTGVDATPLTFDVGLRFRYIFH